MDKSESDYNQCISSLLSKYEAKIIELAQKVEGFEIVNREYFLSIIFEYFHRLSNDEKAELVITVFTPDKNPFFYCKLCPSYDEEKMILYTLNVNNKLVKDVKKVLDESTTEIVTKLRTCNEKFKLLEIKFSEFSNELNKIIHDAATLGIHGNCRIEDKLKSRRKFTKKLKSLFRIQ